MKYSISVSGNEAMVALNGKIYAHDAGIVRDAILDQIEQGITNVQINLAGLTYIDSTGLGVLVTVHKRTKEKSGKLTIYGVQGMAAELIRRTRLDKVLIIA